MPPGGSLQQDQSRTQYNPSLIYPILRINALLLSSPIRTPLIDNEIVLMNTLYKERFPKATQQVAILYITLAQNLLSLSPLRWRKDCETSSETTSMLRS